jgi:hypothetical protein
MPLLGRRGKSRLVRHARPALPQRRNFEGCLMAAGNAPLDSFRTGGAISRVGTPERLDTRQGNSTGPKPTPEEVEADNKARAARLATVRHPMELKREIAEPRGPRRSGLAGDRSPGSAARGACRTPPDAGRRRPAARRL